MAGCVAVRRLAGVAGEAAFVEDARAVATAVEVGVFVAVGFGEVHARERGVADGERRLRVPVGFDVVFLVLLLGKGRDPVRADSRQRGVPEVHREGLEPVCGGRVVGAVSMSEQAAGLVGGGSRGAVLREGAGAGSLRAGERCEFACRRFELAAGVVTADAAGQACDVGCAGVLAVDPEVLADDAVPGAAVGLRESRRGTIVTGRVTAVLTPVPSLFCSLRSSRNAAVGFWTGTTTTFCGGEETEAAATTARARTS